MSLTGQLKQPGSQLHRNLLLVAVIVLSASLLAMAWPRWLASFRYLPVDIAIQRYHASGEIPSARLDILLEYAQEAILMHDHYRFHRGLSVLYLLRAIDSNTPPIDRRDAYIAAAEEATASVQAAPAQSAVWLRLAYVGWILHDEPEDVLAAWKMSIFTGRTDHSQFKQRIEIGIAHRLFMDEEAIAMLRDQLLLAWRGQPGTLVSVLSRYDRSLEITRPLIGGTDPLALKDMEAWLEKLH